MQDIGGSQSTLGNRLGARGKGCRGNLTRCAFVELEADSMLALEPEFTPEEAMEFAELYCDGPWLEGVIAEWEAKNSGKPLEEILPKEIAGCLEGIKAKVPPLEQLAYQFGPKAMVDYSRGRAVGLDSLVDEGGEITGKSRREFIYFFLLLVWPEIKEMQEANPPKTRNDLWEWMKPICYAGFVETNDLDPLLDVCDDLKLKLAKPSAPKHLG
jgi:hypothetical protein